MGQICKKNARLDFCRLSSVYKDLVSSICKVADWICKLKSECRFCRLDHAWPWPPTRYLFLPENSIPPFSVKNFQLQKWRHCHAGTLTANQAPFYLTLSAFLTPTVPYTSIDIAIDHVRSPCFRYFRTNINPFCRCVSSLTGESCAQTNQSRDLYKQTRQVRSVCLFLCLLLS